MATNSRGYFYISQKPYNSAKMGRFTPHLHIKAAWNKLASGEAMTWHEEYAIEVLWHEIVHNQQRVSPTGGSGSIHTRAMEIATQWTARRTYPEFLKSLGATPAHLESIKADGLGYGHYVKSFDRLLSVLKIDEAAMLKEMRRIMDSAPRDGYVDELVSYLSREFGQAKKTIRTAIDKTKAYSYDDELKKLGLLNEP